MQSGTYDDWRQITNLDDGTVRSFQVNEKLVESVVAEQMCAIQSRLAASPLPIKDILVPSGIFAEEGWELKKDGGSIWVIRRKAPEENGIPVEFRPVDTELASLYHRDLHYIHTPRCDLAFGLFLRDDKLPFSVLSLQRIDRQYKQNVLLMHGYNPEKCFDLSRLYSKPGVPFNTSSTIFSLVFSYLRQFKPETQAILSSFMPTYAAGLSMTSGGFDNPVLMKPCVHKFVQRSIEGRGVWEYVSNRRLSPGDRMIESSPTFPLTPTVELITSLRAPRFKPFEEVDGKIVVLGRNYE